MNCDKTAALVRRRKRVFHGLKARSPAANHARQLLHAKAHGKLPIFFAKLLGCRDYDFGGFFAAVKFQRAHNKHGHAADFGKLLVHAAHSQRRARSKYDYRKHFNLCSGQNSLSPPKITVEFEVIQLALKVAEELSHNLFPHIPVKLDVEHIVVGEFHFDVGRERL